MDKLHWTLLILYLTASGGYGGWRGRELWSGWGVWCLLLPPVACAVLIALGDWRRNPMGWTSMKIALMMGGFGAFGLWGCSLVMAWGIGEATERWSSEPAVRAICGCGLAAAAGGLAWFTAKSRKPPEPEERVVLRAQVGSPNHDLRISLLVKLSVLNGLQRHTRFVYNAIEPTFKQIKNGF
jgi:hypothetical protein